MDKEVANIGPLMFVFLLLLLCNTLYDDGQVSRTCRTTFIGLRPTLRRIELSRHQPSFI